METINNNEKSIMNAAKETREEKKIEIFTDPSPFLRQICEAVENPKSPEIKELIDKMKIAMQQSEGIGLAANQIGENKRIFIVQTKTKRPISVFINPKIIKISKEKIPMNEGCLSIPKKIGIVIRPERITIKAADERGIERIIKAKELFARVIQHELDHLDGILYIDKAIPETIKLAETQPQMATNANNNE